MASKKSQAAIEFISTHGWTMLIVLIVIGALVAFGIYNPYVFFPDRIDLGQGVLILDYQMDYYERTGFSMANYKFIMLNGVGKNMYNVRVNVKECENFNGKFSAPIDIPEGKSMKLDLACNGIKAVHDASNFFNVYLEYETFAQDDNIAHSRKGVMKVTPQHLTQFHDNNDGRRAWALENGASGLDDENRFYPCKDVPGCNTPDPGGNLIAAFGGYIDSKTGKVWQEADAPGRAQYDWSQLDLDFGVWDIVQPLFNYGTKLYYFPEQGNYVQRNDPFGTAFTYCESLDEYGFTDWKLTSKPDFDLGIANCNECLPPLGSYPAGWAQKFYWTDTMSYPGQPDDHAVCVDLFHYDSSIYADCSRILQANVRCIRDNP